jgi:hypothetical protein
MQPTSLLLLLPLLPLRSSTMATSRPPRSSMREALMHLLCLSGRQAPACSLYT